MTRQGQPTQAIVVRAGAARRAAPRLAIGWLVLLLFVSLNAHAARWYVDLGGSGVAYSPQFLTIQSGDSVTFINNGGYHNVVADDGSFRCAHGCDADGGNGNASADFWIVTITLTDPGTVGYFCEPHGAPGSGMYGSIEVLAPPPPRPVPGGGRVLEVVLALALIGLAVRRLSRGSRESS